MTETVELILKWLHCEKIFKEEDQKAAKIRTLVHGQEFIMFFIYKGNVYGTNEDGRLTFSSMKAMSEPGYRELMFGATNLTAALKGEVPEEYFRYKDLESLDIVSSDEAEARLLDKPHKNMKSDKLIIVKKQDMEKNKVKHDSAISS